MIEINNLTNIRINEGFLRKIGQKVLKGEKIKGKINLSIALLEPGRMREINKKYRKKDRTTDVLAFPEPKEIKLSLTRKTQNLGEIVICPSEVKKNSRRFNSTFKKELAKVLIHGILHLLGYNHEKSKRASERMRKKEELYLNRAFQ